MVAPNLELFSQAMIQSFNLARHNPESHVVEQVTGILIAQTPALCQQSTKDARKSLVDFDRALQNSLTYQHWLVSQRQKAETMNVSECDDLA